MHSSRMRTHRRWTVSCRVRESAPSMNTLPMQIPLHADPLPPCRPLSPCIPPSMQTAPFLETRMTDTCENITFSHTSYAVGKKNKALVYNFEMLYFCVEPLLVDKKICTLQRRQAPGKIIYVTVYRKTPCPRLTFLYSPWLPSPAGLGNRAPVPLECAVFARGAGDVGSNVQKDVSGTVT